MRVLLIAVGIGYIAYAVQWEDYTVVPPEGGDPIEQDGMITLVKNADLKWLLGGLLPIAMVFPLQTLRWHALLKCQGMNVSVRSVFKLVMIGLFFNFCVPVGSNGGDVVKAYGAARGIKTPGSTTRAVVSVLMDRAAGLLGLIVLAAIAAPFLWNDPTGRKVTIIAWSALGVIILGGAVYLWPVTRKWLGVELMTKLSVFEKIDEAVTGYRHHGGVVLGSVAISVPVHTVICIATAMTGYAIGVETPLLILIAALPIAFITGALPLTLMGMGVMEPTLYGLLREGTATNAGVTFNQAAAMLMGFRAYFLAYALIGGLFVLTKGVSLSEKPAADAAEATV